jgi:predicted RNA-binding Zn-ribbon protein involved in translation (DUF1610 family)
MGSVNMEGDMPKHHQTLLSCPSCGKTGVAKWARETRRQCDLHDLSSGFASIDRGTKAGHHFACQRCRQVALERPLSRAA